MRIPRRKFLLGGASLMSLLAFGRFKPARAAEVTGEIIGATSRLGHRLRKMDFPAPRQDDVENIDVVIIGGGIAGLGAGYRLQKAGVKNFCLLELEPETGGNARSGANAVSAYPWGAHYVPLLTAEAKAVHRLFEEFGIITGHDDKGVPVYNDYYLCADPQERLLIHGRWQEGLVPVVGASDDDRAQYDRFFKFMEGLKEKRGADGKRLFAIPVDDSSSAAEWRHYDTVSMKDWMTANGYTSPYLQWYVDYSCRDDYGTGFDAVSAWAGMHYFAARNGKAANAAPQGLVTWPEGNGFLAKKLAAPLSAYIRANCMAYSVAAHDHGVDVTYFDAAAGLSRRLHAKTAIIAAPEFIAARLLGQKPLEDFSYAPWAVANITLDAMPENKGAELAWDNMIYDSRLLGYVVSTHQRTAMVTTETVLAYYWPLNHAAPAEARQEALARPYGAWRDIFLEELYAIHPNLKGHVTSLDVMLWGHAMIRPTPGFIWGPARAARLQQKGPVFRAHSDLSGISIFEEAYTHGVRAAENALTLLKVPHDSEL